MGRLWRSNFSSCAYTFKISHYAPDIYCGILSLMKSMLKGGKKRKTNYLKTWSRGGGVEGGGGVHFTSLWSCTLHVVSVMCNIMIFILIFIPCWHEIQTLLTNTNEFSGWADFYALSNYNSCVLLTLHLSLNFLSFDSYTSAEILICIKLCCILVESTTSLHRRKNSFIWQTKGTVWCTNWRYMWHVILFLF